MFKSKKLILLLSLCLVMVMVVAGCGGNKEAQQSKGGGEASGGETSADWPTKDITLVYHSAAGSGGDMFLRALAKAVEGPLGVSVIVDNKPGAAGMNAWKAVDEAKDGHTFLGVSSTIVTSPIMNEMPLNYQSFEPLAMLFVDPMIFFVNVDAPWNTWEDFVEDAKANPGKFNIAGGVPGELGFVAAKLLQEQAGIEFNVVPFEGGADAAVSVLGGHVDGAIGEYGEAVNQIEGGKLKALIAFNPIEGVDIPTVQDKGMDIEIEKFRGVLAPKGTPEEVIDIWVDALRAALEDPEFKQYYQNLKLVVNFKEKDEFTEVMADQDAQIRQFMQ